MAGDYVLTVEYNPAGIEYSPHGVNNQAPATTSIDLTVTKAQQNPIEITGVNPEYTYGDEPFSLDISGGSGTGKVSYFSSDNSVARIDGNAVTILKEGMFKIMVIKAADENYYMQYGQSQLIVVKHVEPIESDTDKEYPDTKSPENTGDNQREILLLGNVDNNFRDLHKHFCKK